MTSRTEDVVFEILERITDGFFALDSNWNFTYVNSEAARLLFRSRDDLIGKNIWAEFPEAVQLPFYQQYHKAAAGQVPVHFDAYFSPLNAWFDVRAYPSKNGLTVYFQDTSLEKMETTQKEQHYQSLFQHNPDAVFSFDLEGNYLSVNPAMEKLLGYSKKEYINQSFVPLVYKGDIEKTIRHYKVAASGKTQRYQTKAVHKNGSIIHADVTNIPIIVNGKVVGVYGIAKDITESKKSQEMLKNTEKLSIAGQLAAGIAHEIRNPITAIKGFVKLMDSDSNSYKEYFNIITSEIERIEQILSELLILAKPKESQFARSNINLLIKQIVTLLETQAILNNVEIVFESESEETFVQCDENQLKQVFINYIKNAIEAMPNGGKLLIKLTGNCEQLKISFQDQGVGMSKETLEKLGQPFYSTKEKGTGLGFMVSKRIIENHFGEVQIMSEENKGTTIDVCLPLNL